VNHAMLFLSHPILKAIFIGNLHTKTCAPENKPTTARTNKLPTHCHGRYEKYH